MNRMSGYVRVSRTGGREGDSYISPTVQREKIEQWAELHDVELGEVVVEEDVSGVKALDDRQLGRLVRECEEGDSAGIIVYRLDRFSRSPRHTFEALDRMERSGARLVGVADGVDSAAPSGELVIGVLAGIAREQWKARRDGWAEATSRAVTDGVHVSARAPLGYVRAHKRAPLTLDTPETVALAREVFLRRARGDSWLSLAKFLCDNGVRRSKSAMRPMIENRCYLGEARGDAAGTVTPKAHPAIVTAEEWHAAQGVGRMHAKDGTIASRAMLSGLLTCAGCGHKLSVTGAKNPKTGKREPVYFCKRYRSSGDCTAPASARADRVDAVVASLLVDALSDGTLSATMDAVESYRQVAAAVERAQRDLDALADPRLLSGLGRESYVAMVQEQREILREAQRALRETPEPGAAVVPTADLFGMDWPIERERELCRQYIASIALTRGGKSRWSPPPEERLSIVWAGHEEPDETLVARMQGQRELQEHAAQVLAFAA